MLESTLNCRKAKTNRSTKTVSASRKQAALGAIQIAGYRVFWVPWVPLFFEKSNFFYDAFGRWMQLFGGAPVGSGGYWGLDSKLP